MGIADCRFPIADWRPNKQSIGNAQLALGNQKATGYPGASGY
jgi:hypothetical protein